MKIDCVVVARTFRELNFLFKCHAKLFVLRNSTKYKLVLADGLEVHYMTWDQFESWKLGRTYIHLMDYIMANDCFHHSGHPISKTELRDLILKEGEEKWM